MQLTVDKAATEVMPPEILLAGLVALGSTSAVPTRPTLCFDEAHHNVHTTARGFSAFVDLARMNGFDVIPLATAWTAESLADCDILAVVSPRGAAVGGSLQERGRPAFTEPEVSAVIGWLSAGRGLLFVTDHPPIGAASRPLAERLGIDMSNAFTEDPEHFDAEAGCLVFSRKNGLLGSHPVTDGGESGERVEVVGVFLGQSLAGPPGSASFLTLGSNARDRVRRSTDRRWFDPSDRDPLRPAAGRSQGLAFTVQSGRVVVLGDAAMLAVLPDHSGLDSPGLDNEHLAVNILRWLAGRL